MPLFWVLSVDFLSLSSFVSGIIDSFFSQAFHPVYPIIATCGVSAFIITKKKYISPTITSRWTGVSKFGLLDQLHPSRSNERTNPSSQAAESTKRVFYPCLGTFPPERVPNLTTNRKVKAPRRPPADA